MTETYLLSHCRLVTTDLDQAREHVGHMWEQHESHLRRGRTYGLRWHQATLGRTTLSYIDSASAIDLRCGTLTPVFRFSMPEEGCSRHQIDGVTAESTPNDGVLYAAGQNLRLQIESFRSLLLSLNGTLVGDAAARRFGCVPPMALWPRAIGLGRHPAATLRSLCRWMGRELDRPETPLLTSPRVIASLERSLLTLFMDCLETDPVFAAQRPEDIALTQLRRIEEWLDEHFAEPVGVEDMAAVVGVGARSVQTVFRRVRGYTPTEALLRRRLQYARQRLRRAQPDTSVADIAVESGFFHVGRFAGRYARMFGEHPSETLAMGAGQITPSEAFSIQDAKLRSFSRNG